MAFMVFESDFKKKEREKKKPYQKGQAQPDPLWNNLFLIAH